MKCSAVCSADMRTLVTIEEEVPTGDGYGGQTVVFQSILNGFAKVESKKGHEEFTSQARRAVTQYQMTLRYHPAVTPKMRVSWKGKTGNIIDVENVEERGIYLRLTVDENVGT